MVMPSTVSHLQVELDKMLSRIFDSPKLVAELLKEEQQEIVGPFIKTYVNVYKDNKRVKDGKEIRVMTNFPQTLEANTTLVFVGAGSGKMTNSAIGQVEGEFNFNSNGIITERVKPKIEGGRLTFTLRNDIGELQNVEEFQYDAKNVRVEGNTFTISLSEHTVKVLGLNENQMFTIRYERSKGKTFGTAKGFTANEVVQVVPISNNLDTIRLLDLLIKSALIMLRGTKEETSIYQMKDIEYSAISPQESIPNVENMMFGRQLDISYEVSYGVDSVVSKFLENIDFHEDTYFTKEGDY